MSKYIIHKGQKYVRVDEDKYDEKYVKRIKPLINKDFKEIRGNVKSVINGLRKNLEAYARYESELVKRFNIFDEILDDREYGKIEQAYKKLQDISPEDFGFDSDKSDTRGRIGFKFINI